MKHVPADLFDVAGIGDPWSKKLANARRLLVTMWLLHPALNQPAADDVSSRARAVWDVDVGGLKREGRVTLVTVLCQLRDAGFVRSFDAVEGGFAVELVKEAA